MTDEELDELLEGFATELAPVVQEQLDLVAARFADQVEEATELVAAAYSVSGIRELWNRRIPAVMARLRGIFRRSADLTAGDLDAPVPSGEELEPAEGAYTDAAVPLLEAVGESLATTAQRALAQGVNEGDSLEELKARLIAAFSDTGAQLGPVRADRIAQTESVRAFNAGVLAAAESVTGPNRPLVKQWVTRHDTRVRTAHRDADGQIQLLSDPFDVGGFEMQYPGDPLAPADLTINCRCVLKVTAPSERTASVDPADDEFQSRMPPQLKRYWLTGPGAAKIRWGTPGSFDRCVRELRDDFPQDPEGLCANLHHEATGRWPGQKASVEHTGAMIALVPSAADAARLASLSDEDEDQLHLTLVSLGKGADWPAEARSAVLEQAERSAGFLGPVHARVFGVAQWNPDSDSPVFVWNIGDDLSQGRDPLRTFQLRDVHQELQFALVDVAQLVPEQHSPWAPHVSAAYGSADVSALAKGCGPITFDRVRVAFAGEYTDFPLMVDYEAEPMELEEAVDAIPVTAGWSTPGDDALAYENQQTGDGRVFAPGALYWEGDGPWPLMANENFDSHENASLAGVISAMSREGFRLAGNGLLYLNRDAGHEAAMLLGQGAPLGVSVDLDDVDLALVDAADSEQSFRTRLLRASVLPTPDGGFFLRGVTAPSMEASSTATVTESKLVTFTVGPDGSVPRAAFDLSAAAGDPDAVGGTVVDQQRSGDYLMRVTRARVRGATLVTIPAYAGARITLDDPEMFASDSTPELEEITAAITLDAPELQAATWADRSSLGNVTDTDYGRVLRHVRSSKVPVGPARVAQKLRMPVAAAQRLLALAASRGEVVKLTRGLYTDKTTSARADHVMDDDRLSASGELVASVTGAVDLPVASRDLAWDGPAAETRVFEWADGDTDKLDRAFAYRDDEADPTTKASRKLGYADVVDGTLTIIPRGVFAAEAAVNGARGGVDIPADQISGVKNKLADVRAHVDEETGGDEMDEMQSSAWAAMADLPAMPAAWFREPTAEELPSGGAGVNYSNGRIFGWVAQANEPHAGYAKRIVINDLGRIDTTHFLRQRFTLDDGSSVKAGAFTMNAGHHRDGAECETASCQFDDTRTVAGIVTVGMNDRGMWFSGAAAPWLSEWDRSVFMATQPSYHMKQGSNGNWQLRAVLAVPVPGHSSPLLASAVVERAQLALTAAATMAEVEAAVAAAEEIETAVPWLSECETASIDYDRLADSLVAAMSRAEDRKAAEAAELQALLSEASRMDDGITDEGA